MLIMILAVDGKYEDLKSIQVLDKFGNVLQIPAHVTLNTNESDLKLPAHDFSERFGEPAFAALLNHLNAKKGE